MNALQTFQFHTHQLNVITDEQGEPWFIAKQVAEILEYSDAEAMTRKLDDDEKSNRQNVGLTTDAAYGPNSGGRGITCINESGLYSAILTSKKTAAKAFKRWVTHEVLPSIRKTGSYAAEETILMRAYVELQTKHIALQERLLAAPKPTTAGPVRGAYSAEEDAALLEKRAQGWGAGRISHALNRSYNSVAHRLRRLAKQPSLVAEAQLDVFAETDQ